MEQSNIIKAHAFCTNNRDNLLSDKKCGCFHCTRIYNPLEISEWIDEGGITALCPYCGIDSVIGESSDYPITEDFLREMNKYWF